MEVLIFVHHFLSEDSNFTPVIEYFGHLCPSLLSDR